MGKGRHVVPRDGGWAVIKPGSSKPESTHRKQSTAEESAKRAVGKEGGGEVRIHGKDGRIRDSDTVAPGHDPCPPKDTKH